MTSTTPASDQPDDRPRLVVQATDRMPRSRARQARKTLNEPCPGQLALFDSEDPR